MLAWWPPAPHLRPVAGSDADSVATDIVADTLVDCQVLFSSRTLPAACLSPEVRPPICGMVSLPREAVSSASDAAPDGALVAVLKWGRAHATCRQSLQEGRDRPQRSDAQAVEARNAQQRAAAAAAAAADKKGKQSVWRFGGGKEGPGTAAPPAVKAAVGPRRVEVFDKDSNR